jgi:hypothetical protein
MYRYVVLTYVFAPQDFYNEVSKSVASFVASAALTEESDAPPVKSIRPITHKFTARLRCLEN